MNKIIIDTCSLCAHCSNLYLDNGKIELFCNNLEKNETIGYTTFKESMRFPIPDDCPILITQEKEE